jgi:hypothetical protein
MNRPALAVLLVCCALLLGFSCTVGAQDGTAERSLNTTTVSPGETVEVTVTADLDGSATVDFADTWSPSVAETTVVSVSFDRGDLAIVDSENVALFSDGEVTDDSVEIVYTLSVPADADPGTVYEWEQATEDGDGSILSVGDDARSITGDQQFEVVTDSDDGSGDGGDGGTDDGGDDGTDDGGDGGTDDGGDGGGDDGGDDGSDDGGDGGGDDGGTEDGSDGGSDGSGPGFGFVAFALAATLMAAYSARRSE